MLLLFFYGGRGFEGGIHFDGSCQIVTLMEGNFACFQIVCCIFLFLFFFFLFIQNYNYVSINSFRNTLRVSNILDPYQARRFVGPDMVQNCLQKMLAVVCVVVN